MKSTFLAILLLVPFYASAQSTGITTNVIAVAGVFIFLLMFVFGLRALMLWYWRINEIIKNQEQQISLMKKQNELLAKLGGEVAAPENSVPLTTNPY